MRLDFGELLGEITEEIDRGNAKHGHGELATPEQVALILLEELGEFAQATMQQRPDDARKELLQIAAVACNHLLGTGPHFSSQ